MECARLSFVYLLAETVKGMSMPMPTNPTLLQADLAVDDRGQLTFANQFDLAQAGIRRLYLTKLPAASSMEGAD